MKGHLIRKACFICLIHILILFPLSMGWAAGVNLRPGAMGVSPEWPPELVKLVKSGGWFDGFWVNANSWLFFQGETHAFNKFLNAYSSLGHTPLLVIVHADSQRRGIPWGGQTLIPYDWQLEILKRGWGVPKIPDKPEEQYAVTVDLWIDKQIKLSDVIIPEGVQLKLVWGLTKSEYLLTEKEIANNIELGKIAKFGETTTEDGVQLAWQYTGERIAYLAYHVRSSESSIFELYWTCNGVRDDSRQEKHSSGKGNATYIVNTVPNGPVENTANVILEELPWADNQKIVLGTIDWTERGERETYAGESSTTAMTPAPVKNSYINFQKIFINNALNKLSAERPFKLLAFNFKIDGQKEEIWELYGNWLSKDKLINEYKETKRPRSLCWLLANAVSNGMKEEDITKTLGPGTKPDEKTDMRLRKICEKQGLSLQKNDEFIIYNAAWIGIDLQFRNGILINHKPEEYANPRISWAMSVQPSGK